MGPSSVGLLQVQCFLTFPSPNSPSSSPFLSHTRTLPPTSLLVQPRSLLCVASRICLLAFGLDISML